MAAVDDAQLVIVGTDRRLPVRRVAVVGLLAVGLIGSIVGPALPGIRDSFGVSISQAGLVVVASSLGYIAFGLGGGLVADRWDRRRLMFVAAGMLAVGALGLGLAPNWLLLLLAAACFGAGTGLLDGPGNALINEHSGQQRTADLNLAHGFFGIGSIVGPLVAGGLLAAGVDWRWLVAPGLLVALAMLVLVGRLHLPRRHQELSPKLVHWSVVKQPLVLLLASILCLYVGVELMVGTWAFSFLRVQHGAGDAEAGLGTALYWGGLTVGRLTAGTVGAGIGPHALIVGNTLGAALALALVVGAPTLPLAMLGLALVGLALANIFPAAIGIGGAAYPSAGGAVVGILVAAGGLGGAVFPWLTGYLAERNGIDAALSIGLMMLGLLLVAEIAVMRLERRMNADSSGGLDDGLSGRLD